MKHKSIDEHTLRVLEFDSVRQLLSTHSMSVLGRQAALALYPSTNPEWIERRLAETTELKGLLQQGVRIPIAGVTDLVSLFAHIGKNQTVFEAKQLLAVSDTLTCLAGIKGFFSECDSQVYPYLHGVADRIRTFPNIVEAICSCVQGDGTIRSDASEKLLKIREKIGQLREAIQSKLKAILSSSGMQDALENNQFLVRNGRAVIAIKTNFRHRMQGAVLDRSQSGATLFMEPYAITEIGNVLEDEIYAEKKEVGRILWQLTQTVLVERDGVSHAVSELGLIDLTVAKARFSLAFGMSRAALLSDQQMELRQARHPLLVHLIAQECDNVLADAIRKTVPVDVRLGKDFDLLIVTGPNTGGKTVTLKTVGLLSLMTQSGMHIPAHPDSRLPVYRQIYVDIGDEQSLEQSLSTFSGHIRQISHITNHAGPRALVLLDELGAGTDPAEASALASSILDALLVVGSHVVVTSHLGTLKTYALTTPRAENASVHFDMESLRPTYRLLIGTPGSSNAITIAERLGLAKGIITRAMELLNASGSDKGEALNQAQRSRELAEQKRSAAFSLLEEVKGLHRLVSERVQRTQWERERLTDQADFEIERTMRKVSLILQEYGRDLQNAPNPWNEQAQALVEQIRAVAHESPLAKRQERYIRNLSRDDKVYILSFDCQGTVQRVRRSRGTISCLVEGKELEVPFAEIWPVAVHF
jgi:DNA mismatch repair protein MutS2